MKSFIFLMVTVLASNVLAAEAKSQVPKSVVCSAGELGEDNRISLSISHPHVRISQHESSLQIRKFKTVSKGNTLAILDQNVSGSAEGTDFNSQTSALMVFDNAAQTVLLTVVVDGQLQIAPTVLSCGSGSF